MRNKYQIHDNFVEILCKYKEETVSCFIDLTDLPSMDALGIIHATKGEKDNTYYARARILGTSGGGGSVLLHRFLLDTPKDKIVDHKDRNGMNNRRSNLQETDHVGNARNKKMQTTNTSGHPGICWSNKYGKWHARIWVKGSQIHVGYYDDIDQAVRERDEAKKIHY